MLGLDTRFILFGIFVGISSYLLSTSSVSLLNFTPGKATTLWSLTHSLHHREPIVGNHDPNEKSDPLPVDALSPARRKAFEREEERRKALFYGWTKYRGRKPVYFLSHGTPETLFKPSSGPYKAWERVGEEIMSQVRPKAILAVSAHWQGDNEDEVLITSAGSNDILHDFVGFPKEYYQQTFKYATSEKFSQRVVEVLAEQGLKSRAVNRGLDHGLWVPLKAMFPAKVSEPPIVIQVSLPMNGKMGKALGLGRALRDLRDEGVVMVATGMTVHNEQETDFYAMQGKKAPYAIEFEEAVTSLVTHYTGTDREERTRSLVLHPAYKKSHPTVQHIQPLAFAVGAAREDEGEVIYSDIEGSLAWGMYRFGHPEGTSEDII